MNQGPVWVIQGTICVFLFRSATCVCSNKWPKTTNLPYDQTPFHYIHYIHFSAWHTLTVSYAYPKPLVNEPIDLPSLRLAAWYFENHWSSTISPCDPGSPPQGSTVAVDPSSTGLSGTKRPLLWMVAVFLSSKIHMVNWNWGGYIASVVKAWKSWTRNSSICSQAL